MSTRTVLPLALGGVIFSLSTLAHAHALDHLRTTDDIGLNKVFYEGTSQILVIASRVGTNTFPPSRLAELEAFFDPAGGPGTFRHYWQTVSNGRYDPIPTLVQPVLYPNSCPIPGKSVSNCFFSMNDALLLFQGGVKATFEDVLRRVRDEQNVDLSFFDQNTATGAGQDGYFDGIIVDSDMYSGIAFPLAAFSNTATINAAPVGPNVDLSCGIVAMVPPELHEYGHALGFIDLYGGPSVNGLMADITATLSAFSRQQIGWGQVVDATRSTYHTLAPVLAGGSLLKVGTAPRYVMIEKRGGAHHATYETHPEAVYVYSVDESQLPTTALGFVDLVSQNLYLPNQSAPYLNVNLPVDCSLGSTDSPTSCGLTLAGTARELIHASGANTGYSLCLGPTEADGTTYVAVVAGGTAACDAVTPGPGMGSAGAANSGGGGGAPNTGGNGGVPNSGGTGDTAGGAGSSSGGAQAAGAGGLAANGGFAGVSSGGVAGVSVGGTSGVSGGSSAAGGAQAGRGGALPQGPSEAEGGCQCRMTPSSSSAPWQWLGGLFLVLLHRRRRRGCPGGR